MEKRKIRGLKSIISDKSPHDNKIISKFMGSRLKRKGMKQSKFYSYLFNPFSLAIDINRLLKTSKITYRYENANIQKLHNRIFSSIE